MIVDALIPHPLRDESVETQRRARLIVYAIGIANLASLLAASMMFGIGHPETAVNVLVTIVAHTAIYPILFFSRSTRLAGHSFIWIFFVELVWNYGPNGGYGVMPTIVLPLAAAALVGVRAGAAWTVVGMVWAGALAPLVKAGDGATLGMGLGTAIMTLIVGISACIVEATRARAVAEAATKDHLLQQYRDRIRTFVESTFPGFVEMTDSQITYTSEGIEALTGYASDQTTRQLSEYVHPDDVSGVRRLIDKGVGFRTEVRLRHANGRWFWLEVYGIPQVQDSGDERWIFAARDIQTERQQREQMQRAQRLESIGVMAAGVAHDFNNLLTVIMGRADLLTEKEGRESIVEAAEEASELIARLVDFGRTGPVQAGGADAVGVLRHLESLFRSLLGAQIELVQTVPDATLGIALSDVQLNQVLLNLVTNAKESITGSGRVEIAVSSAIIEPERLQLLDLAQRPYVLIRVTDDGCGMSEPTREKAFDPFYTTKSPGSGSGLGLASIYGIVTRAGGAIDLESQVGSGTTVRVYLPEIDMSKVEVVPSGEAIAPVSRHDQLVLVIDDEARIRSTVESMLVSEGFEVATAANAAEALVLLENATPALIITDIVMPGMRGTEFAKTVRRRHATLPVLFISGYSDHETDRSDWAADRNALFLAKPFRAHEIIDRVDALLRADVA